ncbi:hypothetical protein [Dyella silvae]|uniref:hypothetical protein n=1 Tax=Dyella silvae TaxID=2994424 RepID=UPI002264F67E|nr:hypothetical protein [Dyella silvae]
MKRLLWVLLASVVPLVAHASDVYKVTVTRKPQDIYEVQGGQVYIKTRYCYEYVYTDDAILRIDSPAGYSIGKLIFNSGTSCDVEKVLSG